MYGWLPVFIENCQVQFSKCQFSQILYQSIFKGDSQKLGIKSLIIFVHKLFQLLKLFFKLKKFEWKYYYYYYYYYFFKHFICSWFHFVQIQLGSFSSSSFKLKSLSINFTKLEEDLQPTLDHLTSFFHKNQLFKIVPLQKTSPKGFIFFFLNL